MNSEEYYLSRVNVDGFEEEEEEDVNNGNCTYIPRRATDRLIEADAKLIAAMREVVYGPAPRPVRVRISRNDLYGALGVILLVLAALILAAALGG